MPAGREVSPCCGVQLRNKGRGRFCCTTCGKYRPCRRRLDRRGTIRRDRRGRARIWLGKGHPLANSGGWQYLSRYLVMADLGRFLRRDEHVHHREGLRVDLPRTLEVLGVEFHGRLHASAASLCGWRDELGRFVEHPEWPPSAWPRDKAVTGPAASGGRI